NPFLEHFILDAPHRLHLRDAGIGDAVHVAGKQLAFIRGSQIAIVGNALVKVMGDEVEDVFLEIGPGAADAVNLVLADHLGERQTQLRGAHGSADGDKHLSAGSQQSVVSICGIHKRRGIEVTIVVLDKRRNRGHSAYSRTNATTGELTQSYAAEAVPRRAFTLAITAKASAT